MCSPRKNLESACSWELFEYGKICSISRSLQLCVGRFNAFIASIRHLASKDQRQDPDLAFVLSSLRAYCEFSSLFSLANI